jgi:hypothetical protein
MKKIDQLRQRLQKINHSLFQTEHWLDIAPIKKIRNDLEKEIGGLIPLKPNDIITFEQAIINYRQSTTDAKYMEAKYCCFGLSMLFNNYRLLEQYFGQD